MANKKSDGKTTRSGNGSFLMKCEPLKFRVLGDLPAVEGRPNLKHLQKGREYVALPMGGEDSFFWQVTDNGAILDNDIIKKWTDGSLIAVSESAKPGAKKPDAVQSAA